MKLVAKEGLGECWSHTKARVLPFLLRLRYQGNTKDIFLLCYLSLGRRYNAARLIVGKPDSWSLFSKIFVINRRTFVRTCRIYCLRTELVYCNFLSILFSFWARLNRSAWKFYHTLHRCGWTYDKIFRTIICAEVEIHSVLYFWVGNSRKSQDYGSSGWSFLAQVDHHRNYILYEKYCLSFSKSKKYQHFLQISYNFLKKSRIKSTVFPWYLSLSKKGRTRAFVCDQHSPSPSFATSFTANNPYLDSFHHGWGLLSSTVRELMLLSSIRQFWMIRLIDNIVRWSANEKRIYILMSNVTSSLSSIDHFFSVNQISRLFLSIILRGSHH